MQYYPDIYGIAGQSNPSGRGLLSEMPVLTNYIKILNYNNAGKWVYASEPIDSEIGQVDAVSSDVSPGVGFGLAFGDEMFNLRPGRPVGLVPGAKGASSMADWGRNLSRSTLYGSMIARLQEAASSGSLKGLVFDQGATETSSLALVNAWPAAFTQFVADVRGDLSDPTLPVVFPILDPNPNDPGYPYWAEMVTAQTNMTLPSNVGRVTANDLTMKPGDLFHRTTASQIILGRRFSTKMAELLAALGR